MTDSNHGETGAFDRDLRSAAAVLAEIDDLENGARAAIRECCNAQVKDIAVVLAMAYADYVVLGQALSPTSRRAGWVKALVHGVLEDVLVSTKLLLSGRRSASGNIFRQAMENFCMAWLCISNYSHDVVDKGRTDGRKVRKLYWELVDSGHPLGQARAAITTMESHIQVLGISEEFFDGLKQEMARMHLFSHGGKHSALFRLAQLDVSRFRVGVQFDSSEGPEYKEELRRRQVLAARVHDLVLYALKNRGAL